jgi:nitroimidazol reductase NimA-like FMN-containing flavoprotein (pyridoxamine 5'-phosphate oxidase superfamily)
MRRHDKEISDPEVIREILTNSRILRLGMVDKNEVYIVPVNYAYENGLIYMHSAPHGRKMEILRSNNIVSFEIEYSEEIITDEKPCEWSARYRSVMGKGSITIENDPARKKAGLDFIMRRYGASGRLKYDESSVSRMVLLIMSIISLTGKQSGTW